MRTLDAAHSFAMAAAVVDPNLVLLPRVYRCPPGADA